MPGGLLQCRDRSARRVGRQMSRALLWHCGERRCGDVVTERLPRSARTELMSRPTQSACKAGHASAAAGARRVAGCSGSVLALRGRRRGDVSQRTSSSQRQNGTPRKTSVTERRVTPGVLGVLFWCCEEDVLRDTSPRSLPRSPRTEPGHPATRRAPAAALACPASHALCVGRDISMNHVHSVHV